MHLLRFVLTAAFTVVAVSRGISANANEITRATTAKSTLIHDAVPSLQVATRELSDEDAALEERRGVAAGGHARGGGGGGGGGHVTTGGDGGGGVTTGGLNTNGVTHYKEKKCNRILNWWKRLFSDKIKKCPEEEEEDTRRLRVSDAKP
ncbi:hypothetical protein JG688_00015240 [Phytophthora aleatoria]|uniref:RxLR effector protein n=1 Tax=Phytophthora aleatoria TaxID=2496075 RepID=A0A8J5IZQ1_9STRA|nr:hypothetical protein JG688_00015240 [Phytophthora aleatoria]